MKIKLSDIKYDTDGQQTGILPRKYEFEIDHRFECYADFNVEDWREHALSKVNQDSDWLVESCTITITL